MDFQKNVLRQKKIGRHLNIYSNLYVVIESVVLYLNI